MDDARNVYMLACFAVCLCVDLREYLALSRSPICNFMAHRTVKCKQSVWQCENCLWNAWNDDDRSTRRPNNVACIFFSLARAAHFPNVCMNVFVWPLERLQHYSCTRAKWLNPAIKPRHRSIRSQLLSWYRAITNIHDQSTWQRIIFWVNTTKRSITTVHSQCLRTIETIEKQQQQIGIHNCSSRCGPLGMCRTVDYLVLGVRLFCRYLLIIHWLH